MDQSIPIVPPSFQSLDVFRSPGGSRGWHHQVADRNQVCQLMVELGLREKCQHAKTTPDRNLAVARVRTWDVNAMKTERERECQRKRVLYPLAIWQFTDDWSVYIITDMFWTMAMFHGYVKLQESNSALKRWTVEGSLLRIKEHWLSHSSLALRTMTNIYPYLPSGNQQWPYIEMRNQHTDWVIFQQTMCFYRWSLTAIWRVIPLDQ